MISTDFNISWTASRFALMFFTLKVASFSDFLAFLSFFDVLGLRLCRDLKKS